MTTALAVAAVAVSLCGTACLLLAAARPRRRQDLGVGLMAALVALLGILVALTAAIAGGAP